MNLLQRLYSNAGLPTQFDSQHPVIRRERIRAANAWWRAEIAQMYSSLFETTRRIDVDADVPQ